MRSIGQDDGGQRKIKVGVMSGWRVLRHFILLVGMALVDLSGCRAQTPLATAVSLVRPLQHGAAPPLFRYSRLGRRGTHFYNVELPRVARRVD